MGERRGTRGLELWCKRMTEGYPGVKVENMTTSWRDGLAFCAIIHHFRPELIDFSKLKKNDVFTNNELAFRVAEKYLGIPALLEAEDMVEYSVPDRLSILTYLAQFYQVFGATQDSPSRLVPKRPAAVAGIVSPASTSPPTKMAIRNTSGSIEIPRREPCSKCCLPIFIAERLNVGKHVFHRQCFRCARCNSQLKLSNYYETETENQYCCELCPDEEIITNPGEPSVLTRSLSDEEKTKGLIMFHEDNYSTMFETALESDLSNTSDFSSEYTKARSRFLNTQLIDSASSDEELPDLPKTKPPIGHVAVDSSKSVNRLVDNCSVHNINSDSNQLKTASPVLDNKKHIVTKEFVQNTSLVKSRMSLFQENIDKMRSNDNTNKVSRSDSSSNLDLSRLDGKHRNESPKKEIIVTETCNDSHNSAETSKDEIAESSIIDISDDIIEISDDSSLQNSNVVSLPDIVSNVEECKSPIHSTFDEKQIIDENIGNLLFEKNNDSTDTKVRLNEEPEIENHLFAQAINFSLINEKLADESKSSDKDNESNITEDSSFPDSHEKPKMDVNEEIKLQSHINSLIQSRYNSDDIKEDDLLQSEEISSQFIEKLMHVDEIETADSNKKSEEVPIIVEEEKYPTDLNPFGDDIVEDKRISSNPFGSDEEDEEPEQKIATPTQTLRKIILNSDDHKFSGFNEDTPECLKTLYLQRISIPPSEEPHLKHPRKISSDMSTFVDSTCSTTTTPDTGGESVKAKPSPKLRRIMPLAANRIFTGSSTSSYDSSNPFEDEAGFKVPQPVVRKSLPAPKISLNPFSSDDEDDDGIESAASKPVPKPRYSAMGTPEHKPRTSGNSMTTSFGGSTTSLSSATSSVYSARKKKAAPLPPTGQQSPQNSLTSSPSTSVQHSPRPRKARKAPLPPTSTPLTANNEKISLDMSPIENDSASTLKLTAISVQITKTDTYGSDNTILSPSNSVDSEDFEKEKVAKDELNRNRQSQANISLFPNKSTYGKWKRRKGQAPSLPVPQKRTIKQLPITEVRRELDMIEVQLQGLEKQGVRLEKIIREQCEGPDTDPNDAISIDAEDLILQLFEVVNERNELCRRQAEFIYLQKQHRLEEEHADVEYQIRCIMLQPEANKTDSDKAREEQLLNRLVEIVERRNEIIDSLEMDRVREAAEDDSICSSMNTYASKRDKDNIPVEPEVKQSPKKKEKHKLLKIKKFKLKNTPKVDMDKDVDESESAGSTTTLKKEKKKKKFNIF